LFLICGCSVAGFVTQLACPKNSEDQVVSTLSKMYSKRMVDPVKNGKHFQYDQTFEPAEKYRFVSYRKRNLGKRLSSFSFAQLLRLHLAPDDMVSFLLI
jgi:hypothetical protein